VGLQIRKAVLSERIIFENYLHMKLINCFFLFFLATTSFGQVINNDAALIQNQVKESIKLYNRFNGPESRIYNGRAYLPFQFKSEGIPFFQSEYLENGWISYEGLVYDSINMQYDIYRNQLVVLNDNDDLFFLQNELVDSFHFLKYTFIRLPENLQKKFKNADFYQMLYSGKVKVLAIRKKDYRETIEDRQLIRSFYSQDQYYIFKDGKYNAVTNEKDVLNIFNDKKHSVKSQLRRQKLKLRKKNFENALIAAATIYDQIM
jgi:hypothetical protein